MAIDHAAPLQVGWKTLLDADLRGVPWWDPDSARNPRGSQAVDARSFTDVLVGDTPDGRVIVWLLGYDL